MNLKFGHAAFKLGIKFSSDLCRQDLSDVDLGEIDAISRMLSGLYSEEIHAADAAFFHSDHSDTPSHIAHLSSNNFAMADLWQSKISEAHFHLGRARISYQHHHLVASG